jgi:hypothetical protein
MLDTLLVILKGLLPAVAASLLLVGVFGQRCIGLAMGVGVFTAYALLKQFPPLPHELWSGNNDAMQWLVWSGAVAGLLALAGSEGLPPAWLGLPAGVLLLAAQVWLMLLNRTQGMTPTESALTHAVPIVVCAATWILMRRAAGRRQDVWSAVVWTVCLAADSLLLLLSRSALQGQLAGAAAAALGTAAATALWRRPFAVGRPATFVLASLHGGLLLAGNQLAELPAVPALLAAAAPAALAFAPERQPGDGQAAFVAVSMIAATMLGAALGLVG